MKLSVPMTRTEICFGWIYLCLQLFLLPSLLVMVNQYFGQPLTLAALNFAMFALNFLVATLLFHRYLLESARLSLAEPLRCLRAAFLGLLLYYLGNMVVSRLIFAIDPDFANVNDANISAMTQQQSTLMVIGTVLLVPPVEEVFYRGLIFRGLYNKSRIAAYLVSTLVFSAVHILGYIGLSNWPTLALCFLQYVPASIALAWAYERADSIWAPILMHMTVNQIGILAMR